MRGVATMAEVVTPTTFPVLGEAYDRGTTQKQSEGALGLYPESNRESGSLLLQDEVRSFCSRRSPY